MLGSTPEKIANPGWILIKRLPDWFEKGEPRTSGRYTFSVHQPWSKDSPLLESGLLGPVTIQRVECR
jgi:hypothetical protein